MALEPVKIPQNVYVEDRIIGPVTIRQIIIMGIGGAMSYALWSILAQSGYIGIVPLIIAWIPVTIAAAFAFVKINDISLFRMILLKIEQANKPSIRHWESTQGISLNFVTKPPKEFVDPNAPQVVHNLGRLKELTTELEHEQEVIAHEAHEHQYAEPHDVRTDDVQGSALPPRPVDPSRISVDELHAHHLDGIGSIANLHDSPHYSE
jgi:hypothetical protein